MFGYSLVIMLHLADVENVNNSDEFSLLLQIFLKFLKASPSAKHYR